MNYKVGYPVGEGVYPIFKTEAEAKCLADYIAEAYDEFVEITKTKEPSNYVMKFMPTGGKRNDSTN